MNCNDTVVDPAAALRAQQMSRQLDTDPDYLIWYVDRLTNNDDPDSVEVLLEDLTVPLKSEPAARRMRGVLDRIFEEAERLSLRVAAAAALLHLFPEAESDALTQTLVEALRAADEDTVVNAVSALRERPAPVRLQARVLQALMDLARDARADTSARCIALDALVCGGDVPEVRALAASLSDSGAPAALRREAESVLAFWRDTAAGSSHAESNNVEGGPAGART